jgi:glutathione peroxidase-family protein
LLYPASKAFKRSFSVYALLLVIALLITGSSMAQKSIYSIAVKSMGSTDSIHMSDYAGKKILVAVYDPARLDSAALHLLKLLDTVYKKNSSIVQVIAVPMTDNGLGMRKEDLKQFLQSMLKVSFAIAEPTNVKKQSGLKQEPLLKWLTDKKQNQHFDLDISQGGQIFIINETGNLFAELNTAVRPTTEAELKMLIRQ